MKYEVKILFLCTLIIKCWMLMERQKKYFLSISELFTRDNDEKGSFCDV